MFFLEMILQYVKKDSMLSPQQLKRLGDHKYSAQDSSFLDDLCMSKFWSWLVLKYPLWLAPNTITLIGFVCNITAVLLLMYFSPDGKQAVRKYQNNNNNCQVVEIFIERVKLSH